jgi:rhodanese-related sulfurtransferase
LILEIYSTIPISKEEIPKILPEKLKGLLDKGEVVIIVDCNPPALFAAEHIPGAINLAWNFQGLQEDPELPKNKPIVAYCLCANEEDSGEVALQMIASFGYRNIHLLLGGNTAWKNMGYPMEKGVS